jgi:hypothetical protein
MARQQNPLLGVLRRRHAGERPEFPDEVGLIEIADIGRDSSAGHSPAEQPQRLESASARICLGRQANLGTEQRDQPLGGRTHPVADIPDPDGRVVLDRGERSKGPVKLDKVIAQLQEQPEAVQHWSVDQAGLDDLVARLSTKPGIHAVHLVDEKAAATAAKLATETG